MIREADRIEIERVNDAVWSTWENLDTGQEVRVRTAGVVVRMFSEEGDGLAYVMTRDQLAALLGYAAEVKCDG